MNRAQRLYKELLDRRIPYSHEPWNPAPFSFGVGDKPQRVRGPNETIQGPATCLDLSLLLVGMALSAGMRPFIALRTAPTLHAVVVLYVGRSLSRQSERAAVPPGFTQRAAEPGVWDLTPGDSFDGSDEWRIVDVAMAARQRRFPSMPLPDAGAQFEEAVLAQLPFSWDEEWTLVDIDKVRRTGLEPYPPPLGPSVPAIYG